ncbi:MAG: 30S ribosomal protein S20 [Verrucomicrobia bacterium]|nr:30S ribosomal protein S20 [Verrucomicrobiota bacterium]
MPNTKSAAKALRSSESKRLRNKSVKSALHTLQKRFLGLVGEGKKDEAAALLPQIMSALDKAAKGDIIHRNSADRRKSRLSVRLAALAAPVAPAAK